MEKESREIDRGGERKEKEERQEEVGTSAKTEGGLFFVIIFILALTLDPQHPSESWHLRRA